MLTAENAKEIANKFFVEAEEKSQEWIEKTMTDVLNTIHTRAKAGHFNFEYSLYLDNDNYRIPREKIVIRELNNLNYKVVFSKRSSHAKEFSVFTITWD